MQAGRRAATAALLWAACLGVGGVAGEESALERGFRHPPPEARPWVYWMWMDGNLSREGITADLEAMHRVGIGGVIIMEVDVGIPRGPVQFMSPPWRELFKHVTAEADRLGIEIDLNASPGWTGSGGPWVRPEQSMQKVVFSETELAGPQRFEGVLPQPPTQEGFYRDVAVLAFPTPVGKYRIADVQEKALYARGHYSSEAGVRSSIAAPAQHPAVPPEQVIARDRMVDLGARMDSGGRLAWDVPPGRWTVLRFGRTSTGANTRPAPEPGLGLECDKLDKAALEAHFREYLGKLIADVGPLAGRSWTSLHVDSWEMGPQNWTGRFREEFRRLRGYDPVPYLPAMTGRVVESLEVSERFLWDLRQTVSDLILENHARHLRTLARRHGMRLSIEPYDGSPCDDLTLGACADVPMCEFWANCFDTFFSCTEASSIAHTYGRRIVAAEAFTADDKERWLLHPASMKALGDWAFCQGINRLVFHRYAHQPWLDRWPGMTMGPYGVHYERTQTWWELSTAWHAYLSRCQFMLQQGRFVADVCFLAPEGSPHVLRVPASATRGNPPDRLGYNFDGCTPEALLERTSVQDGRVVLPDGTSYCLLVLPQQETMTPALVRKIKALAEAGATVVGPRPVKSPGLSSYPECDREVKTLGEALWGDGLPPADLTERTCGKGRAVWGGAVRATQEIVGDVEHPLKRARWIWHAEGNPAASAPVGDRYFRKVLTLEAGRRIESARVAMTADNAFELWVNGRRAGSGDNFTRAVAIDVASLLKPGVNVLAVTASNGADKPNPAGLIGSLAIRFHDGRSLEVHTDRSWQSALTVGGNWTADAASGAGWQAAMDLGPLGMAPWGAVGRPVTQPELYPDFAVVSGLLEKMGVPPDFESDAGLRYTHRRDGQTDLYFVASRDEGWVEAKCVFRVSGKVPEVWDPKTGRVTRPTAYEEKDGRTFLPLRLEPTGSVFVVFRTKKGTGVVFGHENESRPPSPGPVPKPVEIRGPWEVRFQPQRGAPEKIILAELLDWSKHADSGVRYFSGTAEYTTSFTVPPEWTGADQRLELDLGKVAVMARVKLNGKDLGILWKPPFAVEIAGAVKPGTNTLEITVANLWPNRLIGDQSLPPEKRVAWTTWNPFAKDAPLLESGLIGPVTLRAP